MAEPHSISILRRKAEEIREVILAYEKRLLDAQHDLAHVNAALRLFEASGKPEDYPAYVDLNRVFRRGEITAICKAAIAAEGPLDTRELTARVMASKGLDRSDKVIWNAVSLRIVQTMSHHMKKGRMSEAERRKGVIVWRLPTPQDYAASSPSTGEIPGEPEPLSSPVNTAHRC